MSNIGAGADVFPAMAVPAAGEVYSTLMTGLLHYWTLDETSGTRVDSLGTYNLPETGGTVVSTASGLFGAAASTTNNTSAYLSNTASPQILDGDTTDWTISAWLYRENATSGGNLLFISGSTMLTVDVNLLAPDVWSVNAFVWGEGNTGTGGNSGFGYSSVEVGTGSWYHVVLSWDVSSREGLLWVNGTAITPNMVPTEDPELGLVMNWDTWGFVQGSGAAVAGLRLDETAMWNRLLTAEEITELYNGGSGIQYPFLLQT